jgi:hypothetical protein
LENKLGGLLIQREFRCQQVQQTQAVVQYIAAQLEKTGDTIEIGDGISRSRRDIDNDLAMYSARGEEEKAEMTRLEEQIATLKSYRERAGDCIAAARQQLRDDEDRLEELQLKRDLMVVVEPIRPLVKDQAPSGNDRPQRAYDHIAQVLDERYQEIPRPDPVTNTPWRELVGQRAPANGPTLKLELPTADRVASK